MVCPYCDKETIGFLKWCGALNLPLALYPLGYLLFRTACGYALDRPPIERRDTEGG